MALALYLIGAPGSGKTAVFDALTNTPEGPSFTTRHGHRYGAVKVPDSRIVRLRDLYKPRKFTPAEVTFVDVSPPGGEAIRFGDMTPLLANADAFVLVIQAFGETDRAGAPLDPRAQMESVLLDMTVSDLEKVERRLERVEQDRKRGLPVTPGEAAVLERCRAALEAETPLRDLDLTEDEDKAIRTFQFLSRKPLLAVANTAEARSGGPDLGPLEAYVAERSLVLLRLCAPLEAEIAQLDAGAQAEFLKDYGLEEPARNRLIQSAYRALRLISFFTVGEDEVRAWTLREGDPAKTAAGKIHSDIERGFIRAETVEAETLLAAGAWARCREQGTLRLEGKTYPVKDGDVINFRFSA